MSKPKTEVDQKSYYKDIYFMYHIFSVLDDVNECKCFIKDILTASELRMLKRRWHIAKLLHKGLTIREVSKISKTSTGTVSRIYKVLREGQGGLKLAIEKSQAKEKKEKRSRKKNKRNVRSSRTAALRMYR